MSSIPDNSEASPFPIIDETLLNDENLGSSNLSHDNLTALFDVRVTRIKNLIDSPIDAFLFYLSNHYTSIEIIIQELEQSNLIMYLIDKYHNHWLKIKRVQDNGIKMLELLRESCMQDIENKPNYKQEGFDPEYMKIIMFIQTFYQKLPN